MKTMTRLRATFLTAGLALAALATAQDPFVAGVRWRYDADSAAPWQPTSVGWGVRENMVVLGSEGGTPALSVLDRAGSGVQAPRFQDSTFPAGATHVATVATSGGAIFTAVQLPSPSVYQRETRLARHDVVDATGGGAFAPTWVHDSGLKVNGPARLAASADGGRVVLAVFDNLSASVQVDFLDGASGALVQRVTVPAAALNAVDVSDGGQVVALAAGLDLYIFDGMGNTLHHSSLPAATRALALAGDGSALAVGGIGVLSLLTPDTLGNWSITFSAKSAAIHVVTAVDLSRDGSILALGWWNFMTGRDVQLDIWDLAAGTRVNSLALIGPSNGPQNLTEVVEVTPDGKHVAFGMWGNGVMPEVLVMRPGEDLPLYGVDTPGSVRDLDLLDHGNRVLVAYKATHNNVASDLGGVLLFEDGTQTISQLDAATTGSNLDVATHLQGAGVAFLLVGDRAAPTSFPGVTGKLWLDRGNLQVLIRPTHAGRGDFSLPLPLDASLVGTQLSMQPAWRAFGGTILGPELIDPLVVE